MQLNWAWADDNYVPITPLLTIGDDPTLQYRLKPTLIIPLKPASCTKLLRPKNKHQGESMAKLTSEQLAFLKSQGISLSLALDAGHLSKSAREAFMKESGHKFYYGGAPCKAAGHTLRSKAGHCIQCDTSKIAYQLRSSAAGYVYLAQSERNGFIKIGFSEIDPYNRVTWLQASAYGDVNDWVIKRSIKISKDAGRWEFEVHAALEKWRKPIVYQKSGEAVECKEIFACSFAEAEEHFLAITSAYQ